MKKILYIGGFQLPDKNAAAQRVVGIAKGLRELGYEVLFLNSLKDSGVENDSVKYYFDFKCYEYKRESNKDYLITAKTTLEKICNIKPDIVVAYNYPGISLDKIRKYCKKNNIKCYADVTEWYDVKTGTLLFRFIKKIDTSYRMRFVQKRCDGVIAISRFLYNYYKKQTNTVLIPPTIDITDQKWNVIQGKESDGLVFVYAGSPDAQKERLDLIVDAIQKYNTICKLSFKIIGINEMQFRNIYGYTSDISDCIHFYGRITHKESVDIIKQADWYIIMRDNNFVVNAGFPTKLVESITCGIPVIINQFSNVKDYLNDSNSIFIHSPVELNDALLKIQSVNKEVDRTVFDYHNYIKELKILLE